MMSSLTGNAETVAFGAYVPICAWMDSYASMSAPRIASCSSGRLLAEGGCASRSVRYGSDSPIWIRT